MQGNHQHSEHCNHGHGHGHDHGHGHGHHGHGHDHGHGHGHHAHQQHGQGDHHEHVHGENCNHGHHDDGLSAEERKRKMEIEKRVIDLTSEFAENQKEKVLKKVLALVQELKEDDFANLPGALLRMSAHLMDFDIYAVLLKLGGIKGAKGVLERNQLALFILAQLAEFSWNTKEVVDECIEIVKETKTIDITYSFLEFYALLLTRDEQENPQIISMILFSAVEGLRFNLKALIQFYENRSQLKKDQSEYFSFLSSHFVAFVQKFVNIIKDSKVFKKSKTYLDVQDLTQRNEQGQVFSKRFDKNLVLKHLLQVSLSRLLELLKIAAEFEDGQLNKFRGEAFSKALQKLRPAFTDSFPGAFDIVVNHNRFYQFNKFLGKQDSQAVAREFNLKNSYSEVLLTDYVLEIAESKYFQFSFRHHYQIQFILITLSQYFQNENKSGQTCDKLLRLFLGVLERANLPPITNISEFEVNAGELLQSINKHYADKDEQVLLLSFFFKFSMQTQYLLFEMCLEKPESMRFQKEVLVYYLTKCPDQNPETNMFANIENLNLLFLSGAEEINLMSFKELIEDLISVMYLMIVVVELASAKYDRVYEDNHVLNKFNTLKSFEKSWKYFVNGCLTQCRLIKKTAEQSIAEQMMQPYPEEKKLNEIKYEKSKCEAFENIGVELQEKLNKFISEFK